jgi:hypothetical protein
MFVCPVCLATAALIAGSATGTGGLTALVAGTILKKKSRIQFPNQINTKEVQNGDDDDRNKAEESGLAR